MESERKVYAVYCNMIKAGDQTFPVQGIFSSRSKAIGYIEDCLKDRPYRIEKNGSDDILDWLWFFDEDKSYCPPRAYKYYDIEDWTLNEGLGPISEK